MGGDRKLFHAVLKAPGHVPAPSSGYGYEQSDFSASHPSGSRTPGWGPCSRTLPLVSAWSPGNRARIPSAWIHRRTDQSLHYEHQMRTVRKEKRAPRLYEMKNSNGKKRFRILALGLPPNHYPSCRSLFRANLFSICNSFTFLCKKKKKMYASSFSLTDRL